jgi:hypothetical protein
MARIAVDETRHAALSWEIDAWARVRLSAAARRRVRDAQIEAISLLLREVADSESASLRLLVGLPDGDEAVATASAVFTHLA